MKAAYRYVVSGSGSNGQAFVARGDVECEFADSLRQAMEGALEQLADGHAVLSRPGVPCRGPYDVTQVIITRTRQ